MTFKSGIEVSIAVCRPNGDTWQSKTLFLAIFYTRSSIVKSAFEFSIAICRPNDDKWQSKHFLANFDTRFSINKSVFDCRLFDVVNSIHKKPDTR